MIKTTLLSIVFCLTALPQISDERRLAVVTQQVQVADSSGGDSQYRMITLSASLAITNVGSQPVLIGERLLPLVVEWKQEEKGGTWKVLQAASWFPLGSDQYPRCMDLKPGKALIVRHLTSNIAIRVSAVNGKKKFRLKLRSVCRQDAELKIVDMTTITAPVFIVKNDK